MVNINLHKPGELDVQLAFPAAWDEMLPTELFEVAKMILQPPDSDGEIKAKLLLSILETRAKQQKLKLPKKWKTLLDAEQLVIEVFPLLDFLFGENNLTSVPEKVIALEGMRPYNVVGPTAFSTITCGEFEDTEVCYHEFVTDPNPKPLAKLAAILWRPKGEKYQTKDANGNLVVYPFERWAKLFEKLEPHRLYAIFIWYCGCKNQIPKIFPTVHEPSPEAKTTEPDGLAFTKCIHAGAGPKNGSRSDIRVMNLFEFMFDMEQEAIKAKELKPKD